MKTKSREGSDDYRPQRGMDAVYVRIGYFLYVDRIVCLPFVLGRAQKSLASFLIAVHR